MWCLFRFIMDIVPISIVESKNPSSDGFNDAKEMNLI